LKFRFRPEELLEVGPRLRAHLLGRELRELHGRFAGRQGRVEHLPEDLPDLLPCAIVVRDLLPGNGACVAEEFIDLLRSFGDLLGVVYYLLGFLLRGGLFRGFLLGDFLIESAE
jgi:hypothetical protein